MILATDMKRHFKLLANLKDVVAVGKKPLFEKQQDRLLLLNALIHAADIGNPCKPVPEFKRWTEMLFKEFFSQGDREKKAQLPISFLCDRADTNIAKAQVDFCKFIVLPMYNGLLPINPAMSWRIENIQENVNYWTNVDKAATAAEDAGTNPVSKT
jgi:hypothetical protein